MPPSHEQTADQPVAAAAAAAARSSTSAGAAAAPMDSHSVTSGLAVPRLQPRPSSTSSQQQHASDSTLSQQPLSAQISACSSFSPSSGRTPSSCDASTTPCSTTSSGMDRGSSESPSMHTLGSSSTRGPLPPRRASTQAPRSSQHAQHHTPSSQSHSHRHHHHHHTPHTIHVQPDVALQLMLAERMTPAMSASDSDSSSASSSSAARRRRLDRLALAGQLPPGLPMHSSPPSAAAPGSSSAVNTPSGVVATLYPAFKALTARPNAATSSTGTSPIPTKVSNGNDSNSGTSSGSNTCAMVDSPVLPSPSPVCLPATPLSLKRARSWHSLSIEAKEAPVSVIMAASSTMSGAGGPSRLRGGGRRDPFVQPSNRRRYSSSDSALSSSPEAISSPASGSGSAHSGDDSPDQGGESILAQLNSIASRIASMHDGKPDAIKIDALNNNNATADGNNGNSGSMTLPIIVSPNRSNGSTISSQGAAAARHFKRASHGVVGSGNNGGVPMSSPGGPVRDNSDASSNPSFDPSHVFQQKRLGPNQLPRDKRRQHHSAFQQKRNHPYRPHNANANAASNQQTPKLLPSPNMEGSLNLSPPCDDVASLSSSSSSSSSAIMLTENDGGDTASTLSGNATHALAALNVMDNNNNDKQQTVEDAFSQQPKASSQGRSREQQQQQPSSAPAPSSAVPVTFGPDGQPRQLPLAKSPPMQPLVGNKQQQQQQHQQANGTVGSSVAALVHPPPIEIAQSHLSSHPQQQQEQLHKRQQHAHEVHAQQHAAAGSNYSGQCQSIAATPFRIDTSSVASQLQRGQQQHPQYQQRHLLAPTGINVGAGLRGLSHGSSFSDSGSGTDASRASSTDARSGGGAVSATLSSISADAPSISGGSSTGSSGNGSSSDNGRALSVDSNGHMQCGNSSSGSSSGTHRSGHDADGSMSSGDLSAESSGNSSSSELRGATGPRLSSYHSHGLKATAPSNGKHHKRMGSHPVSAGEEADGGISPFSSPSSSSSCGSHHSHLAGGLGGFTASDETNFALHSNAVPPPDSHPDHRQHHHHHGHGYGQGDLSSLSGLPSHMCSSPLMDVSTDEDPAASMAAEEELANLIGVENERRYQLARAARLNKVQAAAEAEAERRGEHQILPTVSPIPPHRRLAQQYQYHHYHRPQQQQQHQQHHYQQQQQQQQYLHLPLPPPTLFQPIQQQSHAQQSQQQIHRPTPQ